jgi:hypothetical protein
MITGDEHKERFIRQMKRTLRLTALALALSVLFAAGQAGAQRRQGGATDARRTSSATVFERMSGLALPASDAVAFVEMRRLLTEAMPRALASDAAKLAEANADIDAFKTRTGLDPRALDALAVGSRYAELPGGGVKLGHTVAVARGAFNMATIVSSGRASAKGGYREEKFAGKSVHVFTHNEEIKLLGLLKMRVRELAVAEVAAGTVALGDPAAVRAALDAARGRGALRAGDLAVLSQARSANTLVSFGSRVPAALTKDIGFGLPQVAQSAASVRELYGAAVETDTGLDLWTNLRTATPADARNLSDTLAALKQLAPMFLGRLTGDRGRLARNAVESLRVTTQGSEVHLRLEVPQADISTLVRTL